MTDTKIGEFRANHRCGRRV